MTPSFTSPSSRNLAESLCTTLNDTRKTNEFVADSRIHFQGYAYRGSRLFTDLMVDNNAEEEK